MEINNKNSREKEMLEFNMNSVIANTRINTAREIRAGLEKFLEINKNQDVRGFSWEEWDKFWSFWLV